jgi:ArsR family transcriptional regulator, lead/cadmium/zinc/bismuth-responsive transcriptional repressor
MNKASRTQAQEKAELFSLLSCASRLRILEVIAAKKKITVQDIAELLNMSHSAVSHQLGALVAHEVVTYSKSGRFTIYSLAKGPQARTALRLIKV